MKIWREIIWKFDFFLSGLRKVVLELWNSCIVAVVAGNRTELCLVSISPLFGQPVGDFTVQLGQFLNSLYYVFVEWLTIGRIPINYFIYAKVKNSVTLMCHECIFLIWLERLNDSKMRCFMWITHFMLSIRTLLLVVSFWLVGFVTSKLRDML